MPVSLHFTSRHVQAVGAIIFRNVFLLINGIILAVVVLLIAFGDTQGGLFLGGITVLNIFIGCFQEISSWVTLERLQMLAVPKVIRVNADSTEAVISVEEIQVDDRIKLKTGDQVSCDGTLVSSHGFEVNEALITGESAEFLRKPGDTISAGSIVTAGAGILKVEKIFSESRLALMTKSIKKYSLVQSPIQYSLNTVLRYIGYALLLVILFVVWRGLLVNESSVSIIQNIGALTTLLLPQGMVLVITLLFSYGAAHLYGRNILLQQVNATEKLGRIKNLCMDKTGTLTGNDLVVEQIQYAPGMNENSVGESIAAYIKITGDSSQTITAIKEKFTGEYTGTIIGDRTFSSTRQFGAVHITDELGERVIVAGAPDIFLPHFRTAQDKEWVQKYIDTEAEAGKRLVCFVQSDTNVLPEDLSGITFSALSLVVISDKLRDGVVEAVQFFQSRGVTIRIISGDNPGAVRSVARAAGVQNTQAVITGGELETWTDADFLEKVHAYTVFARIKPEQKEKIIEALKQDGFTAMIGDGANDALAIKKADLGIAMFDGAQATRQIASVVLVKNSFVDLPNGVRLADSVIQNIEISAAIFFNEVFLGFFFFVLVTASGYSFPFTPLNIAFLTYFTIGLPCALVFYWVIRPVHEYIARSDTSFLRQVIPFALVSAIPQALITGAAFYSSLEHMRIHAPTSVVVLSFIMVGVIFFMFAPSVYSGPTMKTQKRQFYGLVIIEIISVVVLINVPLVASFYNLTVPSVRSIIELVPLISVYALVQYGLARHFSMTKA